jgi:hypothetical protein
MDKMNERTYIDIAIYCQEYSNIDLTCDNNNVITLDEIEIKKKDFCSIFYPTGEKFGINKEIAHEGRLIPFISLQPAHRSVAGKRFVLLESIIKNLEYDLNISRNCFTTASRIELANEFSNIKTLCDINSCSVVASLSWSNIEDLIHNYEISSNKTVLPIFCVSVIFKTPTAGCRETILKLNYKIMNAIKDPEIDLNITTTTTTTTTSKLNGLTQPAKKLSY